MVPFSSEETLFILLYERRGDSEHGCFTHFMFGLRGSEEAATSCHISGACGTTTPPPCGSIGKLHLVCLRV